MAKEMVLNKNIHSATGVVATVTSSIVKLDQVDGYSIVAVIAEEVAALTGSAYIEVSHDKLTFVQITNSVAAIAGAGNYMWNVIEPQYLYVRLKIVVTGGTAGVETTIQGLGNQTN